MAATAPGCDSTGRDADVKHEHEQRPHHRLPLKPILPAHPNGTGAHSSSAISSGADNQLANGSSAGT